MWHPSGSHEQETLCHRLMRLIAFPSLFQSNKSHNLRAYQPTHRRTRRQQSYNYGSILNVAMRKSSVNQNLLTLTSTIPTHRNPIKMRKKSRRTTHRRKNRKIKKEITSKRKWLEHKLSQTKQYCNTSFGFCSDPDQSKRKNFNHAITTLPSNLCTQPTNLAFHNLCINQQLPKGSKQLLGLNLSFCLTPRNFHENIKKTMLKLA
jgi:hypothetical protein